MIREKKLYAIVPARGGSKGVSRKNLLRFGGKSLVDIAVSMAKDCRFVDDVIVSTDDMGIFEEGRRAGASECKLRPAELASDEALTIDVVIHHLSEMGWDDCYVLLLQPTSPLRSLDDLAKLCRKFEERKSMDSVVSLVKMDHNHPKKIQKIENGEVRSYLGVESMVPRQQLDEVYALNGAFYLANSGQIQKRKSFFGDHVMPFVMPAEKSINIDGPLDVVLCHALLDGE